MLRISWRIKAMTDKYHVILKTSDVRIHGIKPFANKSAKILNLVENIIQKSRGGVTTHLVAMISLTIKCDISIFK